VTGNHVELTDRETPVHSRFFFILSYGRAGTTLLQGALNNSKFVHCAGENGGFVERLHRAEETLIQARRDSMLQPIRDRPRHAFFGITSAPLDLHRRLYRELVLQLLMASCPAGKVPSLIGFKEVRYPYFERIHAHLDWLNSVFSEPCFVLVTRDHQDVLQSGFFRDLSTDERTLRRENLVKFEKLARDFVRGISAGTELTYDQIAHDPEHSSRALNKIGIPVSARNFEDAIRHRHGY
jgi:hypothetical protein